MSDQSAARYTLFQRKDSPYFWMRFSIPGEGQKRIGLKTDDEAKARQLADQHYQRALWSAEQGLLPGRTSFSKVANQFIEYSTAGGETSSRLAAKAIADKAVLTRYMIPFFGKSTISSINMPKLHAYMDWRRTYWTTGPGKDEVYIQYQRAGEKFVRPARHIEATISTLKREAVILRSVFKHAVRLGFMKPSDIPTISFKKEQRNKRPSFTDAEVEKLLAMAERRVQEASGNARKNRVGNDWQAKWIGDGVFDHRVKYERLVLLCFINIALATGMRPTELHNLNWGHIIGFAEDRKKPLAERRIRIEAHGKGRNPQQLVPDLDAFGNFDNLWQAFVAMHGREPQPDDAVFVNAAGERAKSFKKSLNALLKAAKLKTDAFGRARSAYSFRHTYATRQLRKGTDVYTLALNMRTSVRMIEMYYSDVVPDDVAKRLEGNFD